MTDGDGPGCWEVTLDRELAELIGPSHSSYAAVSDDAPFTGVSADPLPERGGEPAGAAQLRKAVFEAVRKGEGLPVNVYDESGAVLLTVGSIVTRQFLQHLREQGIARVRLGFLAAATPTTEGGAPSDDAEDDGLSTARSRLLDERLAGELQRAVIYRSIRGWRRPRLSIDDLKGNAASGVEKHGSTSTAVADLCARLGPGKRSSASELRKSVTRFVDLAALDFDLLPLIVAMQQSKDEYLYDHCVNVALLSMAMASQLGLDRERITEIGLGGMLHDIGMLRVPLSIRLAKRPLTESEWHEIRRHPLHTLDMLADLRGIPQAVRFIAYQVHERFDGQGYPRRRSGGQLHEYAKLVSVADVYAAMTHERPYRPPVLPYIATKTILSDGALDKFDRALVRAFLDTVSLFPIGSQVGLSNGSAARVLRANPGVHTCPVVEELAPDGSPTGHIIDLSTEGAPHVVKAT